MAFISTLPVTQRDEVRWALMDVFIPANARRKEWLDELEKSVLLYSGEEEEAVLEDVKELLEEVRAYVDKPDIKTKLENFKRNTMSA